MFPLQDSSDIDMKDEQDLCDSPVDHFTVSFLLYDPMHLPGTMKADAL